MNERDDEDTKCQKREEDGESLRNKWKRFSKHEKEDYDASRVWKKMAIAKGKSMNTKEIIDKLVINAIFTVIILFHKLWNDLI